MKLVQALPRQAPSGELVGAVPYPGQPFLALMNRQGVITLHSTQPDQAETRVLLDLSTVTAGFIDSGLLAFAFHPQFGQASSTNRGFVYVWHSFVADRLTWDGNWEFTTLGRLSRFQIPDGSLAADPASEAVLIEQEDRHLTHAGGGMVFNPKDGFLYLSLGNEGKWGNAYGVTQQIDRDLYGGVIRIDVDQRGGTISHPIRRQPLRGRTQHYYIPSDNPWVGVPGALEEFYAIGLRNPYRMSCDALNGSIWVFDVGDGGREEINLLEKGANFEYPYREGTLPGMDPRPSQVLGVERGPFFEYGRDLGLCITGGVIYRGQALADILGGWLVFSDLSGVLYALNPENVGAGAIPIARSADSWSFTSVDVDATGELLVSSIADGLLWRPVRIGNDTNQLPALLSQTGAFADTVRLEPVPSLLAYGVNSPLWSDGAAKQRWMAIPSQGGSNRIGVLPSGEWSFPGGTVFVKHFEIQTNRLDPAAIRRLETRLLVLQTNGGAYGVTYRWRPDGQDAEVLPGGGDEEIVIRTADGEVRQTWHYPSMRECLQCHTRAAGYVLGATPAQLNGPLVSPGGTGSSNQVATLNALGLVHPPLSPADLAALPALVDPSDPDQPMKTRVRSYLEANCSSCHRPGGVRAQFDARFAAKPDDQNLIYGAVAHDLGRPGTRVVVPGDPEKSALYQRLVTLQAHKMPPLGRNTVDPLAESLFRDWILTIPAPRLSSPAPGSRIEEGPMVLVAEVEYVSSWIRHVEFLVNGVVAGVDPTPPYQLELDDLGDGTYEVAAVVRVQDGTRNPGTPVQVEMARGLPSVRILRPAIGPVFDQGLVAEVEASAAAGAELDLVVLRVDGQSVAASSGPRLVAGLPPLAAGLHTLQAEAFDRKGRKGVSTAVQVEVVPLPQVRWQSQDGEGVLAVLRTNLISPLDGVGSDPKWQGYFELLPGMVPGVPDPWGQPRALRLPSGDLGGLDNAFSGLFHVADQALTAGRYVVSLRARALEGTLSIAYGLTDGATSWFTLGTNWSRIADTFRYTPCECYQDQRAFQAFEATVGNVAWEVAQPEVFRLEDSPLLLDLDGRGGGVSRVEARLHDGTQLDPLEGSWGFHAPALPSGAYQLQLRVVTTIGLAYEPPPTTLVIGPRPELVPGADPQRTVVVRGVLGSRIRLESSPDLRSWSAGPVVTLFQPELEVPWNLVGPRSSPALFLRAVLEPLPEPAR
jgi:glucose/arabinose dehydrogenase/mono/diheme cytochrome c family protein